LQARHRDYSITEQYLIKSTTHVLEVVYFRNASAQQLRIKEVIINSYFALFASGH